MPSPSSRHLLRWGIVAVTVLLILAGGAVAFVLLHKPGNVSHPDLSFTRPKPTPPPKKSKPAVVDDFVWARYGYDLGRTRDFPGGSKLNPPFRVGWRFQDYALLEFPPVIYHNVLFLIDDAGSAKAINKTNGRVIWQHKIGTLAAASPALGISQGLVYFSVLSNAAHHGPTTGNGRLVALSMKNGRIRWNHKVAAGTESSPLQWGSNVYFGDQSGAVYSLNASTGHVNWTYHASGSVKGGISFSNGTLYFGDYAGRAYALSANTGHQVWAVSTNGAQFGFGSGNFYSTPAVAFGRVYMGNTDGRVYSFAAKTGQLAWATATGAYVYASPAVADLPGIGPTVYIGSYDGNFYAFDAQSGAVRWSHPAGGRISGSATVVGDVVYYSDLASRTTTGLNARTGQQVFSFPDGAFNPVVCDFGAIYLSGYTMLYELLPKRTPRHHNPPKTRQHQRRKAKNRRK